LDKDRRTREEKAKKERANKIQNEVIQSHKKNVEIDWNWQELEEKEDCKELAEDIEAQKAACAKIISDKQELIREFEQQINQKDSHYIKAIQKMSEDIDALIMGMKDQFFKMRDDYDAQLQSIESEFDRERTAVLNRNKEEIEHLFNEHKQVETSYLDKRQQEEAANAKQLEDVMSQDANK